MPFTVENNVSSNPADISLLGAEDVMLQAETDPVPDPAALEACQRFFMARRYCRTWLFLSDKLAYMYQQLITQPKITGHCPVIFYSVT